ncbi:MAG: Thymidine kinase, partial [uncultured Pseudonocardia sp.]
GQALLPLRRDELRQVDRSDPGRAQLRGARSARPDRQAGDRHQEPVRAVADRGRAGRRPDRGRGRAGARSDPRAPAGLRARRRGAVPLPRPGGRAVPDRRRGRRAGDRLRAAQRPPHARVPREHPTAGTGAHHRGAQDDLPVRPQGHTQRAHCRRRVHPRWRPGRHRRVRRGVRVDVRLLLPGRGRLGL